MSSHLSRDEALEKVDMIDDMKKQNKTKNSPPVPQINSRPDSTSILRIYKQIQNQYP